MDAMNLIESIEQGNANVAKIRQQLFGVLDLPLKASMVFNQYLDQFENGAQIGTPDSQVVYTTEGRFLGTVGSVYESIQPSDFLDSVVESIETCGMEFDLSRLKYKCFSDGKIIGFRQPSDMVVFRNRAGNYEEIELFLNFETGFAGKARTEIGLYSHRFVCSNGMRIIDAEQMLRVKHTKNMNAKALAWCDELIHVASQQKQVSRVWQQMDAISVSDAQIEAFARKLTKVDLTADLTSENCEVSTRKKNILASLKEGIDTEMVRTGKSVFGLLQGATYFTNHLASGASEEYVNVQQGAKTNELAQRLAMELVESN